MAEKRRTITAQLGSTRELYDEEEQRYRSGVQRRNVVTEDAPLVLLVDDDVHRRDATAQMLDRIYRVREAAEASTAIALCAQEVPDIVVTVAAVPDASASRLCQLLELALGDSAPPVVVFSDNPESAAPSVAGLSVVSRPADAISLVAALESVIEQTPESTEES